MRLSQRPQRLNHAGFFAQATTKYKNPVVALPMLRSITITKGGVLTREKVWHVFRKAVAADLYDQCKVFFFTTTVNDPPT